MYVIWNGVQEQGSFVQALLRHVAPLAQPSHSPSHTRSARSTRKRPIDPCTPPKVRLTPPAQDPRPKPQRPPDPFQARTFAMRGAKTFNPSQYVRHPQYGPYSRASIFNRTGSLLNDPWAHVRPSLQPTHQADNQSQAPGDHPNHPRPPTPLPKTAFGDTPGREPVFERLPWNRRPWIPQRP